MNNQSKNRKEQKSEYLNPNWINPLHPVDSAAERAMVACLMDSPKLLPEVFELLGSSDVIANEGYKALLDTLNGLYTEGKPIKLSSIIQRLNKSGEIQLLVERGIDLMSLASEARTTDYAETATYLRGLWVKRIAIDSASDILSSVSAGDDVSTIATKAENLHESIANGLNVGTDRSMSDYVRESLSRMDAILDNPGKLTGVDTGLGKLNKHLGGWQDRHVIMIAGRPGMGKSVAGVFHAYHAAVNGVNVAFLSLEMEASSLIDRMYSMLTGVPYSDIEKGTVDRDQSKKIHVAAGQVENLPIHWYDEPNRDVNDLGYKLLNWKRKHNIGLVIIDYIQLMTDRTVKSSNETEILTSVSKKMKQLQRRLQCPVIELAQLNRENESRPNKRGKMSDLRSTGQFEQDASLIIILFREDYYAEEAADEETQKSGVHVEPKRTYTLEYGVAKNRSGYRGKFVLHADVSLNQIADEAPSNVYSEPTHTERPLIASYPKVNLNSWSTPLAEAGF